MDRIGIVGNGYVGSAVKFGFSPSVGYDADVKVYDIDPNRSTHTLEETVNDSQFIFLSVPTPANPNGSINTDIVEDALHSINDAKNNPVLDDGGSIVLLRSTVTPGTTRRLSNMFPDIEMVFNPEFLTERSAHFDFINQARIILGGSSDNSVGVRSVADLFRRRFGSTISILQTNFESAELVKYMTNTFFATKVSFLNEMKQLSDSSNAVWEDVAEGFVRDGRVGHSHMNIPGPDGKLGFGGSCFPKDIQALISYGELCGVSMNVLKGAWETNLNVRPERDWEQLKGRAVIDDE
tara:strand:+ start:2635 stop:3516 length:882 start_codon:yes stop_codon:yes gene_type:complete